jgi:hypothetical protein
VGDGANALATSKPEQIMRDHNDIEEVPGIELTDHDLMAVTGGTFGYTAMQLAARSAAL